jgi:glycerophosphoryl diester phosphodiesterase
MAFGTATLTGSYFQFDNVTPAEGVVEIIPNSRQLIDAEGNRILAGRVKVTLDAAGSFSVTLPATDDATVEPATGRQYAVVAKLKHVHLPAVTGIELATGATVDVADVSAQPTTDALVSPAATTAQLDALAARVDTLETTPAVTSYNDLTDTPTIPTTPAEVGAEPAGTTAALDATLAPVAKSGAYTDLTGKPTIPTDATAAGWINDDASETKAALSASYVTQAASWDALEAQPYYVIGHRGGGYYQFPEYTMKSYRAAHAAGVQALDADVWLLADGSLGVMHDNTIDRTCATSGNTTDQTAASWVNLAQDAGAGLSAPWTSEPPVLLTQVLDEFGAKRCIMVEAKGLGAADALAAEIVRRNMFNSVMVSSQDWPSAQTLAAADPRMKVQWTDAAGTSQTPAALIAAGITRIAVQDGVVTDATIASLVAAGIKVTVWSVDRHNIRDRYLSLGVTGFFSNFALYLQQSAGRATDPFKSRTIFPGQLTANGGVNGSTTTNPGWFTLDSVGEIFVLQGWASPYDISSGSYQIDLDGKFLALGAASDFLSVVFASPSDIPWTNAPGPTQSGMDFHIRSDGTMTLFKVSNGTKTGGYSTPTAALTVGQVFHLRINVTPTSIACTRTDGSYGTITANASDRVGVRGAYMHFGKLTNCNVAVQNVVITKQ